MKKTLLAAALTLLLGFGAVAQSNTDGFFSWNGNDEDDIYRDVTTNGLVLPSTHGTGVDYNSTPIGSGIAILTLLGAAYMVSKRNKE
ncbi:MAG: hypothetical protein J6W12_04190 [Bacteroidales bacterium]|nr:hypothetical protein [Bacteroidales bacterium]